MATAVYGNIYSLKWDICLFIYFIYSFISYLLSSIAYN